MAIDKQSADIAAGVWVEHEQEDIGAGDQVQILVASTKLGKKFFNLTKHPRLAFVCMSLENTSFKMFSKFKSHKFITKIFIQVPLITALKARTILKMSNIGPTCPLNCL